MAAAAPASGGDELRDDAELTALVATYQAPDSLPFGLVDLPILLIVGPSGAGKDSLKKVLLETGRYYELISHTTRQPRTNDGILEADGHDYYFVTVDRMTQMARTGEFLQVKLYGSNCYGTSVKELLRAAAQNSIAVTDVNVDGAAEFAKLPLNHLSTVFLLPPTFDAWLQRLQRRWPFNHARETNFIVQRLAIAMDELEYAIANANQMAIVINDNLPALASEVHIAMVRNGRVSSTPGSSALAMRLLYETKHYLGGSGC